MHRAGVSVQLRCNHDEPCKAMTDVYIQGQASCAARAGASVGYGWGARISVRCMLLLFGGRRELGFPQSPVFTSWPEIGSFGHPRFTHFLAAQ